MGAWIAACLDVHIMLVLANLVLTLTCLPDRTV